MRVTKSAPSTSFLVQTLIGHLTPSQGDVMPPDGMSDNFINEVECWIAQGANNN
jgi:hypothetical protein